MILGDRVPLEIQRRQSITLGDLDLLLGDGLTGS
jgi:hypothetical protein